MANDFEDKQVTAETDMSTLPSTSTAERESDRQRMKAIYDAVLEMSARQVKMQEAIVDINDETVATHRDMKNLRGELRGMNQAIGAKLREVRQEIDEVKRDMSTLDGNQVAFIQRIEALEKRIDQLEAQLGD